MANDLSRNIFYNTQHSPIGAFASFTLGVKGPRGGLGLERGKPADQNVYIGGESATQPGQFACLPFYESVVDESTRFDVEGAGKVSRVSLQQVADTAITRRLTPGADVWTVTDGFTFAIHTPVCPAPDPAAASASAMKLAYAPALAVELELDNSQGTTARRVI